jgi:hypothetical protein
MGIGKPEVCRMYPIPADEIIEKLGLLRLWLVQNRDAAESMDLADPSWCSNLGPGA